MSEPITTLYIFGSGGHAGVALDLMETMHVKESVIIVTQDNESKIAAGRKWPAADLLTQIEFESMSLSESNTGFHVAIGDNSVRLRIAELALKKGLRPVSIISSTAAISELSTIGVGVFIGPNSHVGPGATVGDFSIVNTMANLEHDSKMGSFSQLAPGACVCGNAEIGEGSFVGANSVVKELSRLGNWSTLGALSFLNFENNEENSTLVGSPAVTVRPSLG
jgi:sugar O-acyltransferase (sialic acid O-acetyltransferase NeuD family)